MEPELAKQTKVEGSQLPSSEWEALEPLTSHAVLDKLDFTSVSLGLLWF